VAHGGLNAAVGIFDATLPILAEPNRPTRVRYLAPVKLDGRGLALDGRRAAWGFGAGVIDSPRHLPALRERALHRLEDTYFRVTRDFGSQSVSAQWRFDRQDSNLQTLSWLQHLQGDVAARFGNDRLTVIPSYTFSRLDDRPGPGIHERHQFGMIETLFALDRGGRWLVSARAEHEYRTRDALISERDANAEVFNLSCRVEARARLSIEGSRLADNTGSPGSRRLDAFVQIGL
jgi:hypothetical protein